MARQNRLLGTLKSLALALLNATLILAALCLWLAWQVLQETNALTASFAQNLISLEPLRGDIAGLTNEVAMLRTDLQSVRFQTQASQSASVAQIGDRVDAAMSDLEDLKNRLDRLATAPDRLIDDAVARSSDGIATLVADLRGCVRPGS